MWINFQNQLKRKIIIQHLKDSAAKPALNGYNSAEENKNNINDNNVFNILRIRQPWNDLVHKVIENQTQRKEDGNNDIDEDDIKLSAEEKRGKLNKRRIQLVIYEWDDVLCTKPNKYSKSTEATIDSLTKARIELSFGGSDRILHMNEHFHDL